MKLEDQVVSFELAKKLKELGVKQDSLFCHQIVEENNYYIVIPRRFDLDKFRIPSSDNRIAAFTVAELGEMLPSILNDNYYLTSIKLDNLHHWATDYRDWKDNHSFCLADTEAEIEADSRAKMLIYLIENKLL